MLGYFKGDDFNAGRNVAPVKVESKNLDANSVHIKSDPNAITPDNPGSWKSYREVPTVTEARAFDEDEADVIREKKKKHRASVKRLNVLIKTYKKLITMKLQLIVITKPTDANKGVITLVTIARN